MFLDHFVSDFSSLMFEFGLYIYLWLILGLLCPGSLVIVFSSLVSLFVSLVLILGHFACLFGSFVFDLGSLVSILQYFWMDLRLLIDSISSLCTKAVAHGHL